MLHFVTLTLFEQHTQQMTEVERQHYILHYQKHKYSVYVGEKYIQVYPKPLLCCHCFHVIYKRKCKGKVQFQ